MILSAMVRTPRLATHVLEAGGGQPVVFIHGNLSDADVWHEQLELLPDGFRGVALDLRGYGRSERQPVDATLGVADYTEDVRALVETLDLGPVHLVAHSMGAAVAYQYTIDHPDDVRTITVVAPMSPYGIGGTRGNGQPCRADFAGSGGGWNNPDFVRLLAAGDRSTDHPASPRNIIRSLFFPQPADVRDEETILESMLRTEVGDDYYPGDGAPSEHWPGVAPGQRGVLNAISPRYLDLSGFARSGATAPVLWVRGGKDAVIADRSTIDLGTLGALGLAPGWPGEDAHPPQPMDAQTRGLLMAYAAAGGSYREQVLDEAGHFAFTQLPQRFATLLSEQLTYAAQHGCRPGPWRT